MAASTTKVVAALQPAGSDTCFSSKAGQWAALPLELLQDISGRLCVADCARARRVCRHWCAAASRCVTSLPVTYPFAQDPHRDQLGRRFPNLTEVHLAFDSQAVSIDTMRRRLRPLSPVPVQALHLDLYNLGDDAAELVAAIVEELPQLIALGLRLHAVYTEQGLQDVPDFILAAGPHLATLHMADVVLSAKKSLQILQALSAASRLRHLTTVVAGEYSRMRQDHLQAIGMMTGLTRLELHSSYATTGCELRCLTSLRELVSLRFTGLHGNEDGPASEKRRSFDAGMHTMLAAMSKLQHLDVDSKFTFCDADGPDCGHALVVGQHLSAVRELRSLSMSEAYTPDTFRSLQQLPFLTRIVVKYHSVDRLDELARLTRLKALTMHYDVHHDFMVACLPLLRNLQELALSSSFGSSPLPSLPQLARLKLHTSYRDLCDVCMLSIGSNLSALRHLELQAETLPDSALETLGRCQLLETCKLFGWEDTMRHRRPRKLAIKPSFTFVVSPALVAHLTSALPRLTLLEFPRLMRAAKVLVERALADRPGHLPKAELIDVHTEDLSAVRIQGK